MVHGCDAQIDHDCRMTEWWTKIRKGNGLNGNNGTHTGDCDLGRGWRGCQARSARLLAGRHCGRDHRQPRGLAAAEDHGRALVGRSKPGSWIVLSVLLAGMAP